MKSGARIALVAALILIGAATAPPASGQSSVTVAVDVDATGNTARLVGAIDNCIRIGRGEERQVDVVLPAPGVPSDAGIKAWQFDLIYDASVVTVTAQDPNLLLAQAPDSSLLTSLTDAVPDSDGTFTSAGVDFSRSEGPEPQGAQEVGPGVIVRITLSGKSQGNTDLTLSNVILPDASNSPLPIGTLLNAAIAVDTTCTPPPAPTPPPSGGDGDGGQPDGTDGTDGTTPLPGGPGTGPEASATTGDGQTGGSQTPGAVAGPGTPVLGGTPVSDGSEDNGDGGLSTGAWIGIGVGIAAGTMAAAGAGWYVLRRRKGVPG